MTKQEKKLEQLLKDVHYALGDLRFSVGCLQPRVDFKFERAVLCRRIEDIQDICGSYKSQSSSENRA